MDEEFDELGEFLVGVFHELLAEFENEILFLL